MRGFRATRSSRQAFKLIDSIIIHSKRDKTRVNPWFNAPKMIDLIGKAKNPQGIQWMSAASAPAMCSNSTSWCMHQLGESPDWRVFKKEF
jgi:hypothetical protein